MSTLAKDAASFKSALARQDYTSWHSNPAPPQPPGDAGVEEPGEKKKKKKSKNSASHFPSCRCKVRIPEFQMLCTRNRRILVQGIMSTRSWSMQLHTSRSECIYPIVGTTRLKHRNRTEHSKPNAAGGYRNRYEHTSDYRLVSA